MDSSESPLRTGPAIDATGIFLLSVTILVFLVPLCIYFPPIPPSHRDALLETHTPIGVKAEAERRRRRRSKGKKDDVAAGSTNANGMALNGQAKPAAAATVRSLWIYPIKSCKGIEISQSRVLPTGLEHDRIYAFAQLRSPFPVGVDTPEKEKSAHRWEFITQRQFPMLATVQVELFIPDAVKARGRLGEVASEPFLLVRFPWQEPGFRGAMSWVAAKLRGGLSAVPEKQFVLPVAFPSRSEIEKRGYEFEEVTVWRDTVMALNMEKELPWELKQYLGVSNRLGIFHIDPARLRNVYRCAPTKQEAGYQPITGFQDTYPLHLLNLSSVRDFDAKIPKDENFQVLDFRRFRANIVVEGDTPYDEESWKKIRISPKPGSTKRHEPATFHVSCRTVRCKMPNVDQDTGFRHAVEPDRSLRRLREVDEGAKLKGCLGMQMTPLFDKTDRPHDLESWVEVGGEIEVLETGSHFYITQ